MTPKKEEEEKKKKVSMTLVRRQLKQNTRSSQLCFMYHW